MKKFLFTLAALMMAGTAFSANYLYIDDIELTKEFVEQSSNKARRIEVPVKAHFDQWSNAWDVTFDYGEITCRGTVVDDEGNLIAPDMVLTGMNKSGNTVKVTVALNASENADHFIAANAVGGYYYPEGSDPDEDDPVAYGAIKWAPGDYECMFVLELQIPQNFEGGDITIATTCASGVDARPGVETAPKNVTDTHVAHVTVEGGAEPEPIAITEVYVNGYESPVGGELATAHMNVTVPEDANYSIYTEGSPMWYDANDDEFKGEFVPGETYALAMTLEPAEGYYFDENCKFYVNGTEELVDAQNTYVDYQGHYYAYLWVVPEVASGEIVPEVTPKPIIEVLTDMESETVTVRATGYGHICIYWDDQLMAEGDGVAEWVIPFGEDPEGEEYGVSATAQEEGYEVSEYALETVFVPGKAEPQPYETPAPEVVETMTDDALMITATGEGTVTIYVQTIDNETGEMTTETYEGEGTVSAVIPRGDEAYFINYWAVAQADEDAVPGSTQVAYFVEVPAKEVTPVDPSHEQGVWIVTYLVDGSEFWQEMLPSNNDYTCIVRFSYGNYGTFPYDPNKSMAENDAMRPDMPFYIVIDGVRYGAAEDGTLCVLGTALSNELFENENLYVLEHALGRVYNMGVAIDELDPSKKYVYAAVAAYTEVEEMNASKTVAGVRYFNMAGQEMQEANGMTIVVTTYTDGTTSAVKVMK